MTETWLRSVYSTHFQAKLAVDHSREISTFQHGLHSLHMHNIHFIDRVEIYTYSAIRFVSCKITCLLIDRFTWFCWTAGAVRLDRTKRISWFRGSTWFSGSTGSFRTLWSARTPWCYGNPRLPRWTRTSW